jgi:hypothetical protein
MIGDIKVKLRGNKKISMTLHIILQIIAKKIYKTNTTVYFISLQVHLFFLPMTEIIKIHLRYTSTTGGGER